MGTEQKNELTKDETIIEIIDKKDLHPTSHEFLDKFCQDSDYDFLEAFNLKFDDIAGLKAFAYDQNTNLEQTMLCLLRISELDSTCTLDTRLPIILYLQDKTLFKNAYLHSLYCIQHWNINIDDIQNDNEEISKLKMLYECHIENLYHLEKYDKVIDTANKFTNKYGFGSSRICHLSFFANVKLLKFKESIVEISKGINMDPTNATLFNHRCYAYCEIGDFESALNDANKCLSIDSKHQIGLNNRGSVYNDLEKYQLAIIDLDKAIKLSKGKNANSFRHRAYSYYMMGEYNKAISDINQALNINHDYDDAKKLKQTMWNDHKQCIQNGIDIYCQQNQLLFDEGLINVITRYVVG